MKLHRYGPRAELSDISFLTDYFHLGSPQLIKDLGGTYNLNLLIQAEQRRYVLRLYRPWMTPTRLSQLQRIKQLLAYANFPVPLPLPTITGKTFLYFHDRLMEMEPFIVHDGEADSWSNNVGAFSLLGQLHTFLALQLRDFPLTAPVVSNYGTPEMLLSWTRQAAKTSIQQTQVLKAHKKQQALSLYANAIHLLLLLQERWDNIREELPRQLVHGDYGMGNVLFEKGHPVAILDFDFMQTTERIFDIAYTLYWWLYKQKHESISTSHWQEVKELLSGYNEATSIPLTLEERWALPLEMARVPLYWIAETHFFPNPAREVLKYANMIADAQWIFEQYNWLIDLFV